MTKIENLLKEFEESRLTDGLEEPKIHREWVDFFAIKILRKPDQRVTKHRLWFISFDFIPWRKLTLIEKLLIGSWTVFCIFIVLKLVLIIL